MRALGAPPADLGLWPREQENGRKPMLAPGVPTYPKPKNYGFVSRGFGFSWAAGVMTTGQDARINTPCVVLPTSNS
jgi:hypothetical protein